MAKLEERSTEGVESRDAKEEEISLRCDEIFPEVEEDFHIINHEDGKPPKARRNKDLIQNQQQDEQFNILKEASVIFTQRESYKLQETILKSCTETIPAMFRYRGDKLYRSKYVID